MSNSISKCKVIIFSLVFSLLSSYALLCGRFIDFHRGAASQADGLGWVRFTAVCVCLFLAALFLSGRGIMGEKIKLSVIMSLFLSAWYLIGKIFYYSYSVLDKVNYIQYAAIFAGMFLFYMALIKAVYRFLEHGNFSDTFISKLHSILTRHTFRNSFIIIILFWLPHMLIKYPSGMCYDSAGQLYQCFSQYSTHHPLAHTLLLGTFVKLGLRLGSAGAGLFAYSLTQTLIGALICSYCAAAVEKHRCPDWAYLLALAFFCLNGHIVFYVGVCVKDVYYALFALLMTVLLCEYVMSPEAFIDDKFRLLMMLAACTGMWVFRNNGKYLVVPVAAVLIVNELLRYRKTRNVRPTAFVLCMVMCVVAPFAVNKALSGIVHAQSGSIAEALSLPFQQTARFVKYHSYEVSEEEREIIDRVLVYDKLAEKYIPELSDPVKYDYRSPSESQALTDYFKLWAKMFFREPICYAASVAEQSYYLFFPDFNNHFEYINADFCSDMVDFLGIYTPDALRGIQQRYAEFAEYSHTAPILQLFNNMSVYIIFICIVFVCVINRRDYAFLVVLLPLIVSILIVFAAPCIKDNPRYVYPCIYAFPVITAFCAKRAQSAVCGDKADDGN